MAYKKSVLTMSKKQIEMPKAKGPGKATNGKKLAVCANRGGKASGSGKHRGKGRKPALAFSTIESRQKALERVKRSIWANLDAINEGIIKLAVAGNYLAAKALFDLAGVYSLPDVEATVSSGTQEPAKVEEAEPKPLPLQPEALEPAKRVQAFLQTLGIERPVHEAGEQV